MDIFIIKIEESQKIPENVLKTFQQKRIGDKKQAIIHCFSYFLLDKILKEKYQVLSPQIIYEGNKPVLESKEKHFSISHSNDYIVLAFSDSNCGVDIEKIKSRDYEKIAERMNFICNDLESFYSSWTLFEAQYKLNKNKSTTNHGQKSYKYEDYYITAVSENIEEDFRFMIEFL